jgi:TetR/AcrR family transcriptional regulator
VATARAIEPRADTREILLATALRIFAAKGYDAASTREIAAEAGINHGLIRYYFGSKSQLWKGAVDRAFAPLESGIAAVTDDGGAGSDRERAGLLIRNYVRFVARHPEFVRLMHEEGKRKGPRTRWLVDRHVKRLFERLSGLLAGDGGRMLRVAMPPIHLHYIVAGSVGLIFHQAEECRRLGVDPFDPAVVEEHARIVEELLLGPDPLRSDHAHDEQENPA